MELTNLTRRTDELRKQMISMHFWNDPIGNRRVQECVRRLHAERRRMVRPDGDRRESDPDRRIPVEGRVQAMATELATLTQRSRELDEVRRKLDQRV